MSVIAAAVEALLKAGVSGDDLVAAVAKIEAAQLASQAPVRTARQERNARYYQKTKARLDTSETSESVLIQTPETVSDGQSPKESAPTPPKETTPSTSEPIGSSVGKVSRKSEQGEFLPDGWKPSQTDWVFAIQELGSEASAQRQLDKFHNFWGGKAGAAGKKRDWSKTWRNWVMREAENGTRASGNVSRFAPRDRHAGTVNSAVSAALARHADRSGLGPGSGPDNGRYENGRDHRPRRDDPQVEDADWSPAPSYRAAGY